MDLKLLEYQKESIRFLENSIKKNRLSHAYIFEGPKGIGKNELAHYFACMLYSKEFPLNLESSDSMQILKDEHLNLYTIYPESKMIKKEEIEALQEEFNKTSLVSGSRVYIISEADKMNASSQNSLLKFIEEPLPDIYGILLCENIDLILPTIRSRCQLIHLEKPSKKMIRDFLNKNGIDKKSGIVLASLTSDFNEALALYNHPDFNTFITYFEKFITLKNQREAIMFLREAQSFLETDNHLNLFIDLLIIYYGDFIKLLNNSLELDLPIYADKMEKKREFESVSGLMNKQEMLFKAKNMLQSNVSPKSVIIKIFINLF